MFINPINFAQLLIQLLQYKIKKWNSQLKKKIINFQFKKRNCHSNKMTNKKWRKPVQIKDRDVKTVIIHNLKY